MSDDHESEDYEADRRIDRQGFNPLMAVGLIALGALALYILFVGFA